MNRKHQKTYHCGESVDKDEGLDILIRQGASKKVWVPKSRVELEARLRMKTPKARHSAEKVHGESVRTRSSCKMMLCHVRQHISQVQRQI